MTVNPVSPAFQKSLEPYVSQRFGSLGLWKANYRNINLVSNFPTKLLLYKLKHLADLHPFAYITQFFLLSIKMRLNRIGFSNSTVWPTYT